jgi:hypothetical protein
MEPWYKNTVPRAEVREGRSFNPTAIKAIRATRHSGTVGQASPFAGSRWMRSGSAS